MPVGQHQWYHFGLGAPPILLCFSGDWDVHWGYPRPNRFQKPAEEKNPRTAPRQTPDPFRFRGEGAQSRLYQNNSAPGWSKPKAPPDKAPRRTKTVCKPERIKKNFSRCMEQGKRKCKGRLPSFSSPQLWRSLAPAQGALSFLQAVFQGNPPQETARCRGDETTFLRHVRGQGTSQRTSSARPPVAWGLWESLVLIGQGSRV